MAFWCPTLSNLKIVWNFGLSFQHFGFLHNEPYSVIKPLVWLQTFVITFLWQFFCASFPSPVKDFFSHLWLSWRILIPLMIFSWTHRQCIFWANCQQSLYLDAKKSLTLATINVLWSCLWISPLFMAVWIGWIVTDCVVHCLAFSSLLSLFSLLANVMLPVKLRIKVGCGYVVSIFYINTASKSHIEAIVRIFFFSVPF